MAMMLYREALNQALREEMRRDPEVFLMGEEIAVFEGAYKVTAGLLKEFGEKRVRDTPIAEEGFVGAGIGAAMLGMKPVVELMTVNFALVAIDQIVNNAAKVRYMFGGEASVPMVIRAAGGGGQQLGAQHSQSFENWFAYVPGLKVVAPATPADAKGMLKSAIRDPDPVIFMENENLYLTKGEVPEGEYLTPLNKADVKRPGEDITIFSYSAYTLRALEAAEKLAQEGISAEVVDLRSLRPLDTETIFASMRKTGRAVIFEEEWKSYGVGAEVAARCYEGCFDYIDAPIQRVAAREVPAPYALNLERAAFPSVDQLIAEARAVLGRNGAR